MNHCCHHDPEPSAHQHHDHGGGSGIDYLLWTTGFLIIAGYGLHMGGLTFGVSWIADASLSIYDLINTMAVGVAIGIVFIGLLGRVPREFVTGILGRGGSVTGILRATIGGVLMDVCSHGVLMLGAKLYERGASTGQVMAFLIASPWNSFSLLFILWAMVGLTWTVVFLLVSFLIAFVSGLVFERLVARGVLPGNPNSSELSSDFRLIPEAKKRLAKVSWTPGLLIGILWQGLLDSRMVLRWIFLGVILAALLRTFVSPEQFGDWFGPTLAGLGLTILAATILEVCSEGTLPVAADILTRAGAPGNSLTFLMTGVSTDYTEIMILREVTGYWKIALFLPLVTLPQIILFGWLLNQFAA